ncbi:MAG: hypothetical protein CM15mP83_7750 [Flavobacteriaceae bacterium]|nr:MAG: hypothetical protein CM15mP83_7750 [Flavobacteriaceae bacterium]
MTQIACSDTDSPPTNFIGIYHTSEGNYYAVEYLNKNTGSLKYPSDISYFNKPEIKFKC